MARPLICILLIVYLLFPASSAKGGRPAGPFQFELIPKSSMYEQGAVMEFTLRIKNRDEFNTHPVLLPGPNYRGKKFIYITAHADDTRYTEVRREDGTGVADSAGVYSYQLKPGKYLDIRLKLYVGRHYAVIPSEPHWFSQELVPGSYQLQAWYTPYEDQKFTDDVHRSTADKSYYNGHTNHMAIKIAPALQTGYKGLDRCPDDCGFCRNIANGKWKKVQNAIETKLKAHNGNTSGSYNAAAPSPGYWLEQHKNVAYISPLPNLILLIFPGHWGHSIGFKSGDSIHYYDITVQLGRLFRGRARLQFIAHWMFRNNNLFRTSDEQYVGLKYFKPITAPNLFPATDN